MYVNRVQILGRLGQDPEVRMTQNGSQVANLSIATSKSWRDNQGKKQEETQWHKIVCWGKLAELASKYLKKGKRVYVEGELKTRSWEDASGKKCYTTEIWCSNLVFIDMVEQDGSNSSGRSNIQNNNSRRDGDMRQDCYDYDNDVPF